MNERQKHVEKRAFGDFCMLRNECKLYLYLPTMYAYCLYPAMFQSPKQLHYCLKIAKTSVFLIVLNGVLYEVPAYTVTVYFCHSTWIRYQKSLIRSFTLITLKFIWPPLLITQSRQMRDQTFPYSLCTKLWISKSNQCAPKRHQTKKAHLLTLNLQDKIN